MKVIYTDQSLISFESALNFLIEELEIPVEKVLTIKDAVLDRADALTKHPHVGQYEPLLAHLDLNHRRVIHKHFKIVYKIEGEIIYVTDIFDSRQNPSKMKG